MKNLKLDRIHASGELDINNWSQTDIQIDKKLIKKIYKYYEKLETRSSSFSYK